jgi:hypothetical protein
MTLIRFDDRDTELDALGFLMLENVALKTWRNGQTAVPESALALLDKEGIAYEVVGRAGYELLTPIRDIAADAV